MNDSKFIFKKWFFLLGLAIGFAVGCSSTSFRPGGPLVTQGVAAILADSQKEESKLKAIKGIQEEVEGCSRCEHLRTVVGAALKVLIDKQISLKTFDPSRAKGDPLAEKTMNFLQWAFSESSVSVGFPGLALSEKYYGPPISTILDNGFLVKNTDIPAMLRAIEMYAQYAKTASVRTGASIYVAEDAKQIIYQISNLVVQLNPKSPELFSLLEKLVHDENEQVRWGAAAALENKRDPETISILSGLLMDPSVDVSHQAISTISFLAQEGVYPLRDDSFLIFKFALEAPRKVKPAGRDKLRKLAISTLVDLGTTTYWGFFEARDDKALSSVVRDYYIELQDEVFSGKEPKRSTVSALAICSANFLNSGSQDERLQAAEVFNKLKGGNHINEVLKFAGTGDLLTGSNFWSSLVKALKDRNAEVRQAVMPVLQQGGARAVPALLTSLGNEKELADSEAIFVLKDIGGEGVPALVEALEDPKAEKRKRVLQVLALLGAEAASAAPPLEQVMDNDPDPEVRMFAERALQSIGQLLPQEIKNGDTLTYRLGLEENARWLKTHSAKSLSVDVSMKQSPEGISSSKILVALYDEERQPIKNRLLPIVQANFPNLQAGIYYFRIFQSEGDPLNTSIDLTFDLFEE